MVSIGRSHVYSHKSHGRLVCLDVRTGNQIWEKEKVSDPRNGACLHLIPNGDSTWIFTEQGDLILARLTPKGYLQSMQPVGRVAELGSFGKNETAPPNRYARWLRLAATVRRQGSTSLGQHTGA